MTDGTAPEPEARATGPSDAELDELDEEILAGLGALHGYLDPPPAGLDELSVFAIGLETVDIEVARRGDELIGSGARATEHSRTVTFDAASLTIMVTIAPNPDGLIRLDGWLAPAGPHRVELRTSPTTLVADTDDTGRFVFDRVPPGLAQLLVHTVAAGGDPGTQVVTPSLVL